ncbi:hypothetical protein GGI07_005761 [Coemansia sp. Benny D115]|nr:hypothetical protein GGI07_005761 [Coemansia sp. Benny D115]
MAASSVQEATKRRIENAFSSLSPKRTRMGTAHNPATQSLPIASTTPTHTLRPTGTSSALHEQGSVSKFRPWSREDLLARMATYKIHTWLVQSPKLSPIRCARNGWVNIDCSTLKCMICSAVLIAEIPEDLTDDEETQWIERLGQQLQSSHNTGCLWKDHACASNVYSVPLVTSRETADEVCQQAADILRLAPKLPKTLQPLNTFQSKLLRDLKRATLELHEKSSGNASDTLDDVCVFTALVLVLFGWRADFTMSRPTVKCEMCFRSAGLWLFEPENSTATTDTATQTLDTEHSDMHLFNVVDEHRSYCYWVHGLDVDTDETTDCVQSTTGGDTANQLSVADSIPGWQKTCASLLRAKTMDQTGSQSSNESDSEGGCSSDSSVEYLNSDNSDSGAYDSETKDSSDVGNRADIRGDILKRLKPFNISAISSAAKAFGIPFDMKLLARAAQSMSAPHTSDSRNRDTNGSSSHSILLTEEIHNPSGWEDGDSVNIPLHESSDQDISEIPATHVSNDSMDYIADTSDIPPPPIDTSGLESLLGDSTLAAALEDPTKASAILDYIKGLIRANGEAST